MVKINGAQALVQSIKGNGVDTIFGLPGVQLDNMFEALHEERDAVRVIHPRHEQSTAYMAFGYAQSTGRVGTCLVVPGPGLLNTAAALSTAYSCNAPVLCLAGQIPTPFIGQRLGMLHELDDQQGALASVVKWSARAESAATTPETMRQAFAQLNSGRRQPVMVEMAPDVMGRVEEVALLGAESGTETGPGLDPDLIEKAAAVLGQAKNPAIFVGGGVFGAEAELLELAETVQAPVFMSAHGNGAVDSRHYLAQNILAGARAWPEIDLALAVGTRFSTPIANWGHDDDIKLIRIDVDPNQSVKQWKPDVHLVAQAKTALAELADRVGRHNIKRPSRADEMNELKAATAESHAKLAPQHEYAMAIRRQLPEDGIACFGLTQVGYYSWFGFPTYAPRTNIQSGYQGTLGFAFPTGLGIKVANSDKKVVAICGDGGFMFAMQELSTAALHGINLVTVVFNDGHFGNVRRIQKEQYDGHYMATELRNPDFMKLADSFGLMGLRANSAAEMEDALGKAFKADEPVLIEVVHGQEFPSPWVHMPRKRMRGGH